MTRFFCLYLNFFVSLHLENENDCYSFCIGAPLGAIPYGGCSGRLLRGADGGAHWHPAQGGGGHVVALLDGRTPLDRQRPRGAHTLCPRHPHRCGRLRRRPRRPRLRPRGGDPRQSLSLFRRLRRQQGDPLRPPHPAPLPARPRRRTLSLRYHPTPSPSSPAPTPPSVASRSTPTASSPVPASCPTYGHLSS